jgi:hypothetical protein
MELGGTHGVNVQRSARQIGTASTSNWFGQHACPRVRSARARPRPHVLRYAAALRRLSGARKLRDCEACGWRNCVVPNANPTPVESFVAVVSWAPAERCAGWGQLEEAVKAR